MLSLPKVLVRDDEGEQAKMVLMTHKNLIYFRLDSHSAFYDNPSDDVSRLSHLRLCQANLRATSKALDFWCRANSIRLETIHGCGGSFSTLKITRMSSTFSRVVALKICFMLFSKTINEYGVGFLSWFVTHRILSLRQRLCANNWVRRRTIEGSKKLPNGKPLAR